MVSQLAYQDLKDTEKNIFFIVGTSRSGSTLLQSMLNSHGRLIIPPETHFFKSYKCLTNLYRENQKEVFRDELLDFWYDRKTRIKDLGLNKDEVKRASQELNLYTPLELFTLQMTMYRKDLGKEVVGEKTPRHILETRNILNEFPEAKIIAMFRDPRAAANSEIKAYFGSPSVTITTRRWREYVEMHKQLVRELPSNQYMMLRYCDLIDDTEGMLKKVSHFLGVDFEDSMLAYYNRDEKGFAKSEEGWKGETLEPLKKNKNEEWETSLSYWQVALIEKYAGELLEEMGYEKKGRALSFMSQIYFQLYDFGKSAWATVTNARYEGYHSPKNFKFKT